MIESLKFTEGRAINQMLNKHAFTSNHHNNRNGPWIPWNIRSNTEARGTPLNNCTWINEHERSSINQSFLGLHNENNNPLHVPFSISTEK